MKYCTYLLCVSDGRDYREHSTEKEADAYAELKNMKFMEEYNSEEEYLNDSDAPECISTTAEDYRKEYEEEYEEDRRYYQILKSSENNEDPEKYQKKLREHYDFSSFDLEELRKEIRDYAEEEIALCDEGDEDLIFGKFPNKALQEIRSEKYAKSLCDYLSENLGDLGVKEIKGMNCHYELMHLLVRDEKIGRAIYFEVKNRLSPKNKQLV